MSLGVRGARARAFTYELYDSEVIMVVCKMKIGVCVVMPCVLDTSLHIPVLVWASAGVTP